MDQVTIEFTNRWLGFAKGDVVSCAPYDAEEPVQRGFARYLQSWELKKLLKGKKNKMMINYHNK